MADSLKLVKVAPANPEDAAVKITDNKLHFTRINRGAFNATGEYTAEDSAGQQGTAPYSQPFLASPNPPPVVVADVGVPTAADEVLLDVLANDLADAPGQPNPEPTPTPVPVPIPTPTPTPVPAPDGLRPIAKTFFGMHYKPSTLITSTDLGVGSQRLWDNGTCWLYLEPSKGNWDWPRLDRYLPGNIPISLPFAMPPAWATSKPDINSGGWYNRAPPDNDSDYANYVRTVLTRYKGKIDAVEGWNEPDNPNDWNSTTARLVQLQRVLYETAKSVDPNVIVVSPGFASPNYGGNGGARSFLQAGGAQWCDVLAVHAENKSDAVPPEHVSTVISAFRSEAAKVGADKKPIWCNEYGFPEYSGSRGAAYTMRVLFSLFSAGCERTHWYGVNYPYNGVQLANSSGALTDAGKAYATLAKLVGGGYMGNIDKVGGVYAVEMRTAAGARYVAYWTDDNGTGNVSASGVKTLKDVLGNTAALPNAGGTIAVGPSPVIAGF